MLMSLIFETNMQDVYSQLHFLNAQSYDSRTVGLDSCMYCKLCMHILVEYDFYLHTVTDLIIAIWK